MVTQKDFCKGIPIFSCISVRGNESYAKIIRFFKPGFSNHTAIYLGQGKNLIIEASPRRAVNYSYLTKYLNNNYELRIYKNDKLTNGQIEKLKDTLYAMMAETESYGWRGLLGFIIPWIKPAENEKFCSQAFVRLFYRALQWRVYPIDCEIDKVSPADIDRYMATKEAKRFGWSLCRIWNKGEAIIY